MNSKLIYKIKLQYFSKEKEVIVYNEICNDGLATKSISIGNNKVSEKTIKDRVLSGECLIDGITCGYSYVYDQEGVTIDLKQTNEHIPLHESINRISKIKKSKEFFKAEMDGLLTITGSPKFISAPSKNFTVYQDITLIDDKNTFTYSLKKYFTCDNKISEIESEEEKYQIDNDYVLFINDLKNNIKRTVYNIKTNEIENTTQDIAAQKKIQSIIDQLQQLKELLKSSPKSYKNLKIESQLNNPKKTIR